MRRHVRRYLHLALSFASLLAVGLAITTHARAASTGYVSYQCGGFDEMAPPVGNLYGQNPLVAFAYSEAKYNTQLKASPIVASHMSNTYAYNYRVPMLINCNPSHYGAAGRGYSLSSATATHPGPTTPQGSHSWIDFVSPPGTRVTQMWIRRNYWSTGSESNPYSWTTRIMQLLDHDLNGDGYRDEHATPLDNVCGVRASRPNNCQAAMGSLDGEAAFTSLQPNARGLRMRIDCEPQSGSTCHWEASAGLQLMEVRLWIEDLTPITTTINTNWNSGCWYRPSGHTAQAGCSHAAVNASTGFAISATSSRPTTGVYDIELGFTGNYLWQPRMGGEYHCPSMMSNLLNYQGAGSPRFWFARSPKGCAVDVTGAPTPDKHDAGQIPVPAAIPSGQYWPTARAFGVPNSPQVPDPTDAGQSPYPDATVFSGSDSAQGPVLHIDNTPMTAHGFLSGPLGSCGHVGLSSPTATRSRTIGSQLWVAGTANLPVWACDIHSGISSMHVQTTVGVSSNVADGPNHAAWKNQCIYGASMNNTTAHHGCSINTVTEGLGTTAATEGQWLWVRVVATDNANNATITSAFPVMRIDNVGPRRPASPLRFEAIDPPVSGTKRAFTSAGGTGWTNSLRVRASWNSWQDASGIDPDVATYAPGYTHTLCPVAQRTVESMNYSSTTGAGSLDLPQNPQAECRQGGHRLTVRMTDPLGNHGETIDGTFQYDSAPGSDSRNAVWSSLTDAYVILTPQSLTTPAGWSTTNSFDVSWTNPTPTAPGRVAPVAAAHYRIGDGAWQRVTAPASCVTWGATCALSGLAVNAPGTHKFEVYLEDAAGNFDRAQSATGSLRLADNSCVIPG